MREWYAEPDSVADIDIEQYAWDAPFDRATGTPSEPHPAYEEASAEAEAYDDPYGYYEDDYDYEDDDWADVDDDDDLLEALSEALDEVEAEEQVEALRERANPSRDVAELIPEPETLYRGAIDHFLARDPRRAPRYSQVRARVLPARTGLEHMLQDSLRRSRESLERWRIRGWQDDLPNAHLGERRPPHRRSEVIPPPDFLLSTP